MNSHQRRVRRRRNARMWKSLQSVLRGVYGGAVQSLVADRPLLTGGDGV